MKKKIYLDSSLPNESEENDHGKEDPDTVCGFGHFRPKWLHSFATPRMYLFLISITGITGEIFYSYQVGVMSTLEKKFSFKSSITGTIMACNDISAMLFGPLVGYFGGRTHRPRALGLGTFLSALSCFISALPYFIYGPARHFDNLNSFTLKNGSDLQKCDGYGRFGECDADDSSPTVMAVSLWMVAGLLRGIGNVAYNSIGMAYMDDNTKLKNIPMYFAITFVLRLFGPLLGFSMSSMCLKYFENPLDDPGYGPDDPRWVGAWWIGFLCEGFLFLLVTVPISMFPRSLPGFKKPVDRPRTDKRINFSGMFVAVKRIFLNLLWWTIMLNAILRNCGSIGHSAMLPKYMEHQFRLTTADSSFYSGVPGIGAVMVAVTLGGYLIWKFRPSMKFLLGMMIVKEIIGAGGYIVLMIPKCEKSEMANFGMDNEGLILEGSCNMNCACSRKSFTPVCGSDLKTLYFSACYAGCEQQFNKTFFSNCSCISESVHATETGKRYATEGFCMSESCWLQAIAYIIAWPAMQFNANILQVFQKLMLLRCIQPQDKSIALGISAALMSLLGVIPNFIIFGALVDSACLVWQSSCAETGSCWFYDTDKLNNIMHGVSAGFSFLAVVPMCLIFCLRGRFYDLYEEDFFYKKNYEDAKQAMSEIEVYSIATMKRKRSVIQTSFISTGEASPVSEGPLPCR